MELDHCRNCIRYAQPSYEVCEKCGTGIVEIKLKGFSLAAVCNTCGWGYAGGTFLAPCEADETKYKLTVCSKPVASDQIVRISRLSGVRSLSVKMSVDRQTALEQTFALDQLLKIAEYLQEKQIPYKTEPSFLYSRIFQCEKRRI